MLQAEVTIPIVHLFHTLAFLHLDFEHVHRWLEWGGYAMLFTLLFACGLGLPLPEDIPLITAGYLISQHHMHLCFAAPIAWMGIMAGDCVLYRFGWRHGHRIQQVPFLAKHVTMARLKLIESLFVRYGVLVVAALRIVAGVRGVMVVAAGTIRFNFIKFIIADGLAAILSGGIFMLLGIWFGSNLGLMQKKAHEFALGLIILGIVAGIGLTTYVWWRSRSHKSLTDVLMEKVEKRVEREKTMVDQK